MNYKRLSLFLITFFVLSFKTPDKTSNFDLRNFETVLSIVEVDGVSYMLKKSSAGQYFLTSEGNSENPMFKVSNSKAKKIDEDFVKGFIHVKYMMTPFEGKACQEVYKLNMRGEEASICKSEVEKINHSKTMFALFKKHF